MLTIYVIPNIGRDANDMILKLTKENEDLFCILQQGLIEPHTKFINYQTHSVNYSKYDSVSPNKLIELIQNAKDRDYVSKLVSLFKNTEVYLKMPAISSPYCNFEDLDGLSNSDFIANERLHKEYIKSVKKYEQTLTKMIYKLIKKYKSGTLIVCLNPIHFRRIENLRMGVYSSITECLSTRSSSVEVIYLLEDYIKEVDKNSLLENREFLHKFILK